MYLDFLSIYFYTSLECVFFWMRADSCCYTGKTYLKIKWNKKGNFEEFAVPLRPLQLFPAFSNFYYVFVVVVVVFGCVFLQGDTKKMKCLSFTWALAATASANARYNRWNYTCIFFRSLHSRMPTFEAQVLLFARLRSKTYFYGFFENFRVFFR